MFEKYAISCPSCGENLKQKIEHGDHVICPSCSKKFDVFAHKESHRAVFVEPEEDTAAPPLYLPKGSIRALVTLLVSCACWILILLNRNVPGYLFNLVLAIIGYYFAYRKAAKAAGSYLFEWTHKKEEPLFLPNGFIRIFLILGFLLCSGWLVISKVSFSNQFMQFMVLLWGLIIGYLFTKLSKKMVKGGLNELINHLKGLLVIIAACGVFAILLLEPGGVWDNVGLFLAATISFYFGSKT